MNTRDTEPMLASDHPGFADATYRARRSEIADLAQAYRRGEAVARVAYSDSEEQTWRVISDALRPLHERLVCDVLRSTSRTLGLFEGSIPQLEDLNLGPLQGSGVRFEPVEGLVPSRTFFDALGRGVFLSTQYLRHGDQPFYTPEPDVVHEVIGHAASLTLPEVARVNRAFGQAAASANDEQLVRIERLYWYAMEFGLVRENGAPRAFGAGLLSSVAELQRACERGPLEPFRVEDVLASDYVTQSMNPRLFIADSVPELLVACEDFLGRWTAPSSLA